MAEAFHNHQVFTLKEVLNSIQKTLSQRYQSAYWMKAEMNKLNYYAYSGHCYPDLVEKKEGKVVAQARAIIWSLDFRAINQKFREILKEPLKDGINILFLAKITFTPEHGLSLQILDIDPSYSLGILEQEKQENIAKLQQEGIFRKNKSLQFPVLPQRIAVISVETSKGYADFLKILQQNSRGYRFVQQLFPARLQGELAVSDIIRQLQKIKKCRDIFDVVAIIRGGGGEVGLSAFNHYALAKEIAGYPLPVLTGIGHATNETITEMVAFRNAITPTECAQFLLDQFEQFDLAIQQSQQKLVHQSRLQLSREKEKQLFFLQLLENGAGRVLRTNKTQLESALSSLKKAANAVIKTNLGQVHQTQQQIRKAAVSLLKDHQDSLEQLAKNINLVNPENILKRGFSITKYKGKCILPEDPLPEIDSEIETVFYQGSLISTITQKKENETGNQA